jgi:uncharacterized protein YdcH (DUF465 family)
MTQQQYDEYLEHLRAEHQQLDKAISILEMDPQKYYEAISELKKKKLKVKDQIYLTEGKHNDTKNHQTING